VELPGGERWTVSARGQGTGEGKARVALLRTEPRPGGGSRVATAAAEPGDMRLVMAAGERSIGKGTDVDLIAPVTPPAEFRPAGKPDGYQRMDSGACFRNAFTVATSSPSLLYGDGYALMPLGGSRGARVRHAWVTGPAYLAVDVTWREAGTRCFGITVSPDELRARQLRKRRNRLVEQVLATMLPVMLPVAGDLPEVTWDLADWFTGRPARARGAGHSLEAG
jgi:hypothetical protein